MSNFILRGKRGLSMNSYAFLMVVLLFSVLVYYQYDFISETVSGISCGHSRRKIEKAIVGYFSRNTENVNYVSEIYKPVKLHILYEEKLLHYVPTCPDNGEYQMNENGKIYCTYHNRMEESKY